MKIENTKAQQDINVPDLVDGKKKQMRKGVLELCILSIIAEGEAYSSDIIEKLKNSELAVVEGTIYPLLTRLKKKGVLSYSWRESDAGPPRKYYNLTELGLEFLRGLMTAWQELVNEMNTYTKHIQN